MTSWDVKFLSDSPSRNKQALIILNQPFSHSLFSRVWTTCEWRCCADGGANRLFDLFSSQALISLRASYLPDLIKGDFDSVRPEVLKYYAERGVPIVEDHDQDSTDLMKCVDALTEREHSKNCEQYDLIILGGLAGRLDQTIHTLSYLHKLRKSRKRVFAITDDNVGWVLDEGEHFIEIDHSVLGPTCGLLPVGIDSTMLSTTGLRWNLTDHPSSFDGLVSTSNHLVSTEKTVWIRTSRPIWWTVELRLLE